MNIVLIGFMGSGKTTVGQALSVKCGREFLDTDALIEAEEGRKISEIFAKEGEGHFRTLENATLRRLLESEDKIISTGGGIVTSVDNRKLLKDAGRVVYLRVKPETVVKRLKGDESRPLLLGEDKLEKVERLLSARRMLYEEVADLIIDVDNLTAAEIADKIGKNFA